jgi:capsule polysaccharide export protein KpsE/RkpR
MLASQLRPVRPARDSNVITVSYTAAVASEAAAFANAIVDAYIAASVELRTEPAKRYNTFFDARAKQLRDALEAAQGKLSAYQREKGIIVATDERFDVENARLSELSTQLVSIQAVTAESAGRQAQLGRDADSMPEVLPNSLLTALLADLSTQQGRLTELRSRLGERHPDVQLAGARIAQLSARIEAESRRVTGSIKVNNNVNESRLVQARLELEAQRAKVLRMKSDRDGAAVLVRDVENARRAYGDMSSRVGLSQIESTNTQANIAMLKRASVPGVASFPKPVPNIASALILGLLLALATVIGRLNGKVPDFYSPHGSRSLQSMRTTARLLHLLTRPFLGRPEQRAIANGMSEAKSLETFQHAPVRLIEAPVDDAFLGVAGKRARFHLVVTSSRSGSVRSVERFAQLAVLLGGDALRISFNWFGSVDPASLKRLQAAKVGIFDIRDEAERALRVSAGWVYVALGGGRSFPLGLVEAMAVGVPCIALDTPFHRDLVRHGETGYICRSQAEVIDRIAQLIDAPSLCKRIGLAASTEARNRFNSSTFSRALRDAYDLREWGSAAGPMPVASDTIGELTLDGQR